MKTSTAMVFVAGLSAAGLGAAAQPAAADDVADFYKGRTITISTGSGIGGGYGVYAMLIREHIGRFIPGNPNVIVTYNPGGGGQVASDYAYNVAPRDGTWILAPLQSMPTLQLVGKAGIRYNAAKFSWIGRAAKATSAFVARTKVAGGLDALLALQNPIVVGTTQPGAPNYILPALLRYCPGVKMRLVAGYKGSAPVALAFQRMEVDGLALPFDSLRLVYPELLKETIIAQSGLARSRDFPEVPLAVDLCKDAEKQKVVNFFQVQEEMGRSYAVPPDTPRARVAALRAAFDAMMKDPALLAQAQERRLDIDPLSGPELQRLVENHIATSGATVSIAKQAVELP